MRALWALLLVAAGCDAAVAPEPSAGLLQTDAGRYDVTLGVSPARVEVDIPYTLRSPDGAATVYAGCFPPHSPELQKLVDGEWVRAYDQVHPLCLSPPFVLPAGEARADTLRVRAALPGQDAAPTFEPGEIAGTYRLVQAIYASADDDGLGRDPLPLEARVSNPFELR